MLFAYASMAVEKSFVAIQNVAALPLPGNFIAKIITADGFNPV